MHGPSKKLKAALRECTRLAWEAEMRGALLPLALMFDEWKSEKLSTSDLNQAIHEYHNGAAREIWRRFATDDPTMPLAYAVASGVLPKDSLPAEVLEHIASKVEHLLELEEQE